jgi:tetratricopeptide (TPR) repeat protein
MHLQDSESDVTPDVDIYINLILCCLRLNKNDELDKLFDLALEYYPKNTTLLNLLISKHQQEGNSEEAKKIQDQLFKMENKIGDGYLGKINQKQLKQFRTDKLTEKLMNEVSQNLKDIKIENTTSVDRLYFAAAFLVLGELDRFKEFICSVSEFEYNLFMKFLLKNSIFNDESFFKVDKIPEEYLPLQYLLKDVNIFPDSHTEDMEEDYIPAEDLTKDFLKSQKHKN